MSRIKVLEIMTHYDTGGVRTHVESLVEEFSRDLSIEVVMAYGGDVDLQRDGKGFKIFEIKGLVREISPIKDIIAVFRLYRICRSNKFHIVHTHGPKAGFIGRLAAFLARVPVIVHTHHGLAFHEFLPWHKRTLYIALEKMAGRVTTHFISVANYNVEQLIKNRVCKSHEITVIPNGINTKMFRSQFDNDEEAKIEGIAPEDFIVGCITRIDPFKNLEMLVEVAQRLHSNNPAVKLLLVGGGPSYEEVKLLVKEKEADSYIIMTGPRQDVPKILKRIDVFAFTSKLEGMPYSIIEAMAAGKAVVSTAVGGIPEIIEHGNSGFLVKNFEVSTFVEYIEKIITNRELRQRIGLQAQLIIEKDYDALKMANRVKNLLLRLYDQHRQDYKLYNNHDKINRNL